MCKQTRTKDHTICDIELGNNPHNVERFITYITIQHNGIKLALTTLWRYYHPSAVDHFYTTDFTELLWGAQGYVLEGPQCQVFTDSSVGYTTALYRYYNATITDHFYTIDYSELGPGKNGYTFEKIQCYVFANPETGSLPLYRYWSSGAGDHFYTTDVDELGFAPPRAR